MSGVDDYAKKCNFSVFFCRTICDSVGNFAEKLVISLIVRLFIQVREWNNLYIWTLTIIVAIIVAIFIVVVVQWVFFPYEAQFFQLHVLLSAVLFKLA
jgi:hypothetical protein